jgi:azurin
MHRLLLVTFVATAAGCKSTEYLAIESVGDTMAYDQSELTVHAGHRVHLTLTDRGTQPAMKHNWVLIRPGAQARVAAAGERAGLAHGYLPDNDPDIIAHTPLAEPGQTAEVTFDAPPAGRYPYECTSPGHWQSMHGTLIVLK